VRTVDAVGLEMVVALEPLDAAEGRPVVVAGLERAGLEVADLDEPSLDPPDALAAGAVPELAE
jgi:hypothetical protein